MVVKSGSERATAADSPPSAVSRSQTPRPEGSMPHALLVDDDVNFALGLAEVVGREGFSTKSNCNRSKTIYCINATIICYTSSISCTSNIWYRYHSCCCCTCSW